MPGPRAPLPILLSALFPCEGEVPEGGWGLKHPQQDIPAEGWGLTALPRLFSKKSRIFVARIKYPFYII